MPAAMTCKRRLLALLLCVWTISAQAFERIAALAPKVVIPGHGHPGSLAKTRRETGDYLDFLIDGVSRALADWKELGETTDELGKMPAFRHLKFYDGWHRHNINRAYLQLEAAQ